VIGMCVCLYRPGVHERVPAHLPVVHDAPGVAAAAQAALQRAPPHPRHLQRTRAVHQGPPEPHPPQVSKPAHVVDCLQLLLTPHTPHTPHTHTECSTLRSDGCRTTSTTLWRIAIW